MDIAGKVLYHQLHPLKLATDIGSGLAALALFWNHDVAAGLAIAAIPPLAASILLVAPEKVQALDRIKASGLGIRMKERMSAPVQALRLALFVLASAGAWLNSIPVVMAGLLSIAGCWYWVLFFQNRK